MLYAEHIVCKQQQVRQSESGDRGRGEWGPGVLAVIVVVEMILKKKKKAYLNIFPTIHNKNFKCVMWLEKTERHHYI